MPSSMTTTHRFTTRAICTLIGVLFCMVVSAQEGQPQNDAKSAELDLARQLIRQTPCPGESHNPVRVIRSVNGLHSLGKKQAVSLLLEVASSDEGPIVVDPDSEHGRVPVQVGERHDQRVCMIVPLLFDVSEKGTPPPDAWCCKQTGKWRWAAGTQVIQGGIPFAISGEWTYGGRPYPTRPLVEWAAKHGELRAERLHPQDDPLQAADALCDRIRSGVVVEFESWVDHIVGPGRDKVVENLEKDLRAQAIRMLHNGMLDQNVLAWDEMRQEVAQLGIRWYPEMEAHMLISSENASFDAESVLQEIYLARNKRRTIWSPGITLSRMRIRFNPHQPATNYRKMEKILQQLCDEGHISQRSGHTAMGNHWINEDAVYERIPDRELTKDE